MSERSLLSRFHQIQLVHTGEYSSIYRAKSFDTEETVAIKRLRKKIPCWSEALDCREVVALRRIGKHKNFVRLKELVRQQNRLYLIFDHVRENLRELLRQQNEVLPEAVILTVVTQLLPAIAFLHKRGMFHRAIKPENIFCTTGLSRPDLTLKLADFSSSCNIQDRPPYSDFDLTTMWYRAPELLLEHRLYSTPVDIWAAGCVILEVVSLQIVFHGMNNQDMLHRIGEVLGPPTEWEEARKLSSAAAVRFKPGNGGSGFDVYIPAHIDGKFRKDLLELINGLLMWDPQTRLTALESLKCALISESSSVRRISSYASHSSIQGALRKILAYQV